MTIERDGEPVARIHDDAAAIATELAELRRSIHAEPEIGLDLPRTQRKVLDALAGLPLEISTGKDLTSVTAVLRGGRPGKTVLLRGDMDALPVTERTGLPYASKVEGAMHACGHDLHTAMLAGAAQLLSARQAELAGNVIFMFQPGEEGPGGARIMVGEGVLDAAGERPVAAYALHVISSLLPLGMLGGRVGPIMAAADTLHVTVHGRGGHGSQPHSAADPVPAACEIVLALQTMVTRRFDIFDPVVITVGTLHAGVADNVISDDAHFVATVRTFSAQARDRVAQEAPKLARDIASAHGMTATAEFVPGYPVTVNNAAETEFVQQTISEVLGEGKYIPAPNPVTGSEDFSYVLDEVPGSFVFLGACPPDVDPGTAPFNHSAHAVFDDAVLPDGTALYAELALRRLADAS
ncbi:MAG TPA: M20 family metallopeptidase [Streptosporangiaceae bacterium]|nr:M20 family metallopeptidase [Streptosporangiaceae bacterium]